MWAQCADFDPKEDPDNLDQGESDTASGMVDGRDYKAMGRIKHECVEAFVKRDFDKVEKIRGRVTERDMDDCEWVADRMREDLAEHDLVPEEAETEKRVALVGDDFEEVYFGTPDLYHTGVLMDSKFGLSRNYFPQLVAYALPKMIKEGRSSIVAYVYYGWLRRRPHPYTITREVAQTVADGILAKRRSKKRFPQPCEYCHWCAKAAGCSALNAVAVQTAEGRPDWPIPLKNYHPSKISDPVQMGLARLIWSYLKKWGEAVEYHSKLMADTKGIVPTGFSYLPAKPRKDLNKDGISGLEVIADRLTMDPKATVQALEVSSKKLVEIIMTQKGISEKKAREALAEILEADDEGVFSKPNPGASQLRKKKDADAVIAAALEGTL